MKKYLIIQGIAAAVIMFGGAGMASADYFGAAPINNSKCNATSTVYIAQAQAIASYLQLSPSQAASLLSPANLYLYNASSQPSQYTNNFQNGFAIGLCLQPGYVSNVPAGINTAIIFNGTNANPGMLAAKVSTLNPDFINDFQNATTSTTSPYAAYPSLYNQADTVYSIGVITPAQAAYAAAAAGTSSVSYSVSVNYDKFTAESKQYGYQSVYTTTGTKTVPVTVFKFNDSPAMTAAQVIAKLSGLGYRPATLSELYAVASQAGNNVVGLGTNLEGGYGYPITGGTGGAGMNHGTGPFNTSTLKFAAVQN